MPGRVLLDLLEIVGHDDQQLVARHFPKQGDDLARGLGVEVAGRLVG